MTTIIEQVFAIVLLFFLPGYTLVQVLFPRKGDLDKEHDALFRITLGIGLSVCIVILDGFLLGSLGINPETGMGYFTAPFIWGSLLGITGILFFAGWLRGAYPWMGKIHRKLYRPPPPGPTILKHDFENPRKTLDELHRLSQERMRLKRAINDCERRGKYQNKQLREHYEKRKQGLKAESAKIQDRIEQIERERAERLYEE